MNKYIFLTIITLMLSSSCRDPPAPQPRPVPTDPAPSQTAPLPPPEPRESIDWQPFAEETYQNILEKEMCSFSYVGGCGEQCDLVEEEIFTNQEIVKLINDLYVAIRVDLPSDQSERALLKEIGVDPDALPSFVLTFKPGDQRVYINGYVVSDIFKQLIKGSEQRSQACALAKGQ